MANNDIFGTLIANASNLQPVMAKVRAFVMNAIQRNFDSKGRWDGKGTGFLSGGTQKWKPLANSTKKKYKKQGITDLDPTLNRSQYGLYKSIQVYSKGTEIHATSAFPYANVHQFGYKNTPARPYITLAREDIEEIVNFVVKYMTTL